MGISFICSSPKDLASDVGALIWTEFIFDGSADG